MLLLFKSFCYRTVLTTVLSLYCVSVGAQIVIMEVQPIKFPKVLQNSGLSTTVVINWKGAIGNSTNSTLLDSDYSQGRYYITSDTSAPIDIDFTSLGNEPLIQLKNFKVRYKNKTYKTFPILGLDNPGTGGEYIDIGAKVVANKKSSQGFKALQYSLSVQEQ
ncbi:hypothetical protein [Shewanella donghaensis]|uniref:hypothetical protein n=1 Tax=Shewanella donghaensis TaxID=238836 RepID=UPI001183E81C|nr:hypothetical protein [Shewanella donghaensis]